MPGPLAMGNYEIINALRCQTCGIFFIQHGNLVSARMKCVAVSIRKPYICKEVLSKLISKVIIQLIPVSVPLVL